ncbi:MAG: ribosomal protein S18-alanine N-acetyltransferase [Gammaproteobacteria bacterium]|nr:ribosomal protein S18-alanine N-acetyltransferase [Gammaproteobacteria bacterium]
MMFEIKPLSIADLPLLVVLEQQSHSHPMSEKQLASCLGGRYFAMGAWRGERLLGFAIAETVMDEGTLIDLVVATDVRRSGIARRLLEALLQRWQQAGVVSVFLEVRAGNQAALQLYHDLGFNEIGLRRGYYPAADGREDAVQMAYSLGL